MKRKQKLVRMHPIERAMIRQKWTSQALNAQIHALTGADREKLLAYGSVMFSVSAACAIALGWDGDEPDMRIVRASVNALDDLAKRPTITDVDRGSLYSGLQAAARIIAITPADVVDEAAWMYAKHSNDWKGIA